MKQQTKKKARHQQRRAREAGFVPASELRHRAAKEAQGRWPSAADLMIGGIVGLFIMADLAARIENVSRIKYWVVRRDMRDGQREYASAGGFWLPRKEAKRFNSDLAAKTWIETTLGARLGVTGGPKPVKVVAKRKKP